MFIPRHSVIENQFCSYAENTSFGSAGIGGVVAYAGSVVYLDPAAANEESMVKKMDVAAGITNSYAPFGFLMQKVKVGYHNIHPTGFVMPGDLGSSDAIAQPSYNSSGVIVGHKSVPVGVAHMGIYDTVHYTATMVAGVVQTKMIPGANLYAAAGEARLTNNSSAAAAVSEAADILLGKNCSSTIVARVMKGLSVAKVQANINNTTLYPMRVKLLV